MAPEAVRTCIQVVVVALVVLVAVVDAGTPCRLLTCVCVYTCTDKIKIDRWRCIADYCNNLFLNKSQYSLLFNVINKIFFNQINSLKLNYTFPT